jgi:hypothetical protein
MRKGESNENITLVSNSPFLPTVDLGRLFEQSQVMSESKDIVDR